MEITPEQLKEWLDLLGKPTAGLLAFVIIILYRELVIDFCKTLLSWFKKHE